MQTRISRARGEDCRLIRVKESHFLDSTSERVSPGMDKKSDPESGWCDNGGNTISSHLSIFPLRNRQRPLPSVNTRPGPGNRRFGLGSADRSRENGPIIKRFPSFSSRIICLRLLKNINKSKRLINYNLLRQITQNCFSSFHCKLFFFFTSFYIIINIFINTSSGSY